MSWTYAACGNGQYCSLQSLNAIFICLSDKKERIPWLYFPYCFSQTSTKGKTTDPKGKCYDVLTYGVFHLKWDVGKLVPVGNCNWNVPRCQVCHNCSPLLGNCCYAVLKLRDNEKFPVPAHTDISHQSIYLHQNCHSEPIDTGEHNHKMPILYIYIFKVKT